MSCPFLLDISCSVSLSVERFYHGVHLPLFILWSAAIATALSKAISLESANVLLLFLLVVTSPVHAFL